MQPPTSTTAPGERGALEFSGGALLSRILGLARDAAIAALLGGGWGADAFLAAFRLPNFMRRLFAEGAFAYTLTPAHLAAQKKGTRHAWSFVRTVALALAGVFSVVAFAGALFPEKATRLLAPGFFGTPELLAATTTFLALCLPYLPFAAAAAVFAAALMAEGEFRAPAYAPATFNTVVVASAGLAFIVYGPENLGAPYVLCAGTVAAGAAQCFWLLAALRGKGFALIGPIAFRGGEAAQALKSLPCSAFGAAGNQLNLFAAAVAASFLAEGGVSALYFAERLIEFPLGVISASLGLAALADLSALAPPPGGRHEESAAFAASLAKSIRMVVFFGLPAAVGTACLAPPLTDSLFGRGAFGSAAVDNTSAALLAYSVGLPALALVRPFLAAFGALGDAKTPMKAALLGLGITAVGGCLSLHLGAVWGPALAVSAAAWANAAFLARALAAKGFSVLPGLSWVAKTCAACLFMTGCVITTADCFASSSGKVAACVPLGVLTYFIATAALRVAEARSAVRVVLRLLCKKA